MAKKILEHRIRDGEDFQRHMDYIHYNLVKHGYVGRVQDWEYSTFHRCVRLGVYEHQQYGGQVIGNKGEPYYPAGTIIPPSPVRIMRPSSF